MGAESPISEQAQGEQATPVPAAPGSFQSFIVEKERSSRKPRDKAMEEAAEAAKQAENQSAYQKIAQLYPKVRDKITRVSTFIDINYGVFVNGRYSRQIFSVQRANC